MGQLAGISSGAGLPLTTRTGGMFPDSTPVAVGRCRRCGKIARLDRMVQGYGRDCAEQLGLVGGTVDVGQDGPDLLDLLGVEYEPDDECDGWDRPADRP